MKDHQEQRLSDMAGIAAHSPCEADRYPRLLQGINRILTQAIRAESEEALGNVCLAVALEVTDSATGFLSEVGSDGLLQPVAISERNGEQGQPGPSSHYRPPPASMLHELYDAVVSEGKSLLTNDLSSRSAGVDLPASHLPLTALLGAPLIYDGRTVGVLAVANREGGYGPQQQEDLEALTPTVVECLYRRRAEKALRESETLYRAIAQHFPDGAIYIFDHDLRFRVADGEAMARLGLAREQLEGKTIWEATDEETCKILEQRYPRVLAGEKLHFETPLKGRVFSSDYVPIHDDHGNVTAGMVVSHDITERVRAKEALRESKEAVRGQLAEIDSIYRSALVGLCVFDDQLRYVRVNERLAEMNGVPAAEHIGKTLREVVPDLADQAEALLRQILDTGEPMLDVQFTGTTPAQPGVLRTWIAQWLPIKDAAGRVVGVNVVANEITERVQAEEALRASEEAAHRQLAEIDSIYRSAPVGLCVIDDQLRFVRINERMAEINGVPAAEHIGRTPREVVPDLADQAEALLWRILDTGEPVLDVQVKGTTPAQPGVLRTWIEQWLPIKDAAGRVVGVNVVADEITERVRAEETLRESETRWRALATAGSDVLYIMSPDWREMRLLQGSGFLADTESPDATWLDKYIPPDDQPHVNAVIQEAIRSKSVFDLDHHVRQADGSLGWTHSRAVPILDAHGEIIEWFGAARDITVRRQAEEALREVKEQHAIVEAVAGERQRLLDVLETLPAMIALLTPDHRIAFANRAFREKFGASQGHYCYECCFGRAEPCSFCETYRVLETSEPHHWEVTLTDGTLLDAYDLPFTDVDGTPMILEMNIDITEARRAQEALVHAERMAVVGRMAATLAHEINNPLQAVVGCLGLAMEVLPENEDADRYMSVAMEELKRAARIVQRIRDLGRQSEGRRELSDLGDLVQRTIVLTHERARGQGVEVWWDDNGAQLPLVPLVRDRIQQVFLNLTLNALDAMPEGGELRISAAPTEEPAGVGISFADTGEGMPPETMERLFEAFYTTKPLELGLGLGLHVSRSIIQEHGGRIDVESEVGRGTTFTVWLPTGQGE